MTAPPPPGDRPPPDREPQDRPPPWERPPPSGPAPGLGYPRPGYSDDDRTWALVAHFGGALLTFLSGATLGWVPPLIAYLAKGRESPTVRAHSLTALNFFLLWSIISVVGWMLGACGTVFVLGVIFFGVPIVATVIGTVFGITAGIKAAEGEFYRYPLSKTIVGR